MHRSLYYHPSGVNLVHHLQVPPHRHKQTVGLKRRCDLYMSKYSALYFFLPSFYNIYLHFAEVFTRSSDFFLYWHACMPTVRLYMCRLYIGIYRHARLERNSGNLVNMYHCNENKHCKNLAKICNKMGFMISVDYIISLMCSVASLTPNTQVLT